MSILTPQLLLPRHLSVSTTGTQPRMLTHKSRDWHVYFNPQKWDWKPIIHRYSRDQLWNVTSRGAAWMWDGELRLSYFPSCFQCNWLWLTVQLQSKGLSWHSLSGRRRRCWWWCMCIVLLLLFRTPAKVLTSHTTAYPQPLLTFRGMQM